MVKFKPLRANLHVQFVLGRPILHWQDVYGRFCDMIYDAQKPKFAVGPSDFSISHGASLADVRARYNIFSGASTATLFSDRLAFEFPGLLQQEVPTVIDMIGGIQDALPRAFPEAENYQRIDVQDYEHLELLNGVGPAEFLQPYKISGVEEAFREMGVVVHAGMKTEIIAQDQSWRGNLEIDRSILSAAAVFTSLNISLLKLDPKQPFSEKVSFVQHVGRTLLGSVQLESHNAPSTAAQ